MRKGSYLFVVIIISFGSFVCFSQDTGIFRPSLQHEEDLAEEDIIFQNVTKDRIEELKKDQFDIYYAAQAVRENRLSCCDKASDPEECISLANEILDTRKLAEGDCEDLSVMPANICKALNSNNCNTLKRGDAEICQAFAERDIDALYNSGRRSLDLGDLADAEELINFYYGFKYYSEAACNRFKSPLEGGYYEGPMICKILFGSQDLQAFIDETAKDLAYLSYVKENKGSLSICDKIDNSTIREGCKSPRVKSLGDFLYPIE